MDRQRDAVSDEDVIDELRGLREDVEQTPTGELPIIPHEEVAAAKARFDRQWPPGVAGHEVSR